MVKIPTCKIRASDFRPHGRSGFTLVELLVVLSLILILSGVAVTSVATIEGPKQQLRREARGLLGLFAEARREAMIRKMNVDVYVSERSVLAMESSVARQLRGGLDESISLCQALDGGVDSNRFVRTVTFSEEFELQAFSADQIETGEEENSFFREIDEPLSDVEPAPEQLAFRFTHFGGASGGGVSLLRDGRRLDLACDILTGRPAPVQLREESP